MLQQDKPDDYVIATGVAHSVREFVNATAKELGIEIIWRGEGVNEKGYWKTQAWEKLIIAIDDRYFRPTEVPHLLGDFSKAKKLLGWEPSIGFDDLVKEMVQFELKNYNQTHPIE